MRLALKKEKEKEKEITNIYINKKSKGVCM